MKGRQSGPTVWYIAAVGSGLLTREVCKWTLKLFVVIIPTFRRWVLERIKGSMLDSGERNYDYL